MSDRLATHLSTKSINDYRRRTMSPAELIIADDHIAACDTCYQRVSLDDREDVFLSVPTEALATTTGESDHLSYEQLASYVDGEQDEVEREICDVHLQICNQCSDELRDLNVLKAGMSDAVSKERPASLSSLSERIQSFWRRPRQWSPLQFASAATLAALVVAGFAWSIWTISRSGRTEIAESTRPPTTSESPAPSVEGTPVQSPSPVALPQIVLTLNDGGGQLTLDREGNLAGLGDLSPSHQQAVRTVLMTGQLNLPFELTQLSREAGVLMGGKSEGVSFALLTPVGTFVRTTRPTFHWQPLAGASAYIVNIYDSSFSKVATSQQLSGTQWTIPSSLQRGIGYLWQVTAIKDNVEIKSPVQPAPEARFKILEQSKADELERVRRAHPRSHLTLGTLYAQAGLLDEAEREFRALLVANPKSSVAQKLLRNVRALKQA